MIPPHVPANGVPWVFWKNNWTWKCSECGQTGRQPEFTNVTAFAKALGDIKRGHAACGPLIEHHGVGHPLNPDRVE